MSRLRRIIVTGLGTGRLPLAPGSWGSAAVCAIFLLVVLGSGGRSICVNGTLAVITIVCGAACVWLGRFAQEAYGGADPNACTLDEWAGQAVALLGMPLGATWRDLLIVTGGAFLLFRFFDVVKPPPARRLERLGAGWGILLDDVVAAIYANAGAQLIFRLALKMH